MWGERGVGGFFEDVHVLVVVVLGMSILLGSLATAYVTRQHAQEVSGLREEAYGVLRSVLQAPSLLHGGKRGVLEIMSLETMNSTWLARLAGPSRAAQLIVSERSGEIPRTFLLETVPLRGDRVSVSTAASVWHSDLDVRTARITITLGV